MLRLTRDERAVAEVAAIAEHVASLTAAAAAFRLLSDVPSTRPGRDQDLVVRLIDQSSVAEAADTLGQVHRWAKEALSIDHVPAIWRALAHDARLLDATWRKDQLVLAPGILDKLVKGCTALAVAEFRQSDYWIAYLTQYLRQSCGADDRVLVEVAGSVMHYVSFNTVAHAMRLEAPISGMKAAEVAPGGRHEHLVPGVRRPVTARSS